MSAADTLRAQIQRMVNDAVPIRQHTVAAVRTDGTVDLAYGSGVIESVPCSGGYPTRAVGDKVWVIRSPAGNWEVLVRSGT